MKKILFIDDNDELRKITLEALDFEGFHAIGANCGQQGIEIAKEQKPDIILCDIMMPEIDGFEVYNRLRQNASTSLTPFIFLTALAEKENIRKGMEHGADDYLIKPFTLQELIQSINARIKKSVEINQQIEVNLDELRQRVISHLPHELLTPLNGILGFADLLSTEIYSFSKAEIREMVWEIREDGNRLHALIQNFNSYLKALTYLDPDLENIDIADRNYTITALSKEIAKKYDRTDDLFLELEKVDMRMCPGDFEYIIKELVDNAFKFSKPNSKVIVGNTVHFDYIELWIKDYGRGFPIEKLSDIGAFNQFDRNKFEQQGSGLGLITSMLIVQRYKGELTVTNNQFGTTVTMRFPIESPVYA